MTRVFCLLLVVLIATSAKAYTQANLITFTNSLWSSFGLPNPTNLQQCFNASTSNYFFEWLESAWLVSNDTLQGNLTNYMLFDSTNEIAYGQYLS